MTRDEAIGRIKARFDKWALDDEDMKAIQTLIPELSESEDERIRKEINILYSDIDACITELLKARTDKDSESEGKALFKMEGLMVATLQDLSCIEDYLEKQKEPENTSASTMAPSCWEVEQKEQNGEDEECTDFIIYHPLKNGKGEYECIPYSFYDSLTFFSEDKDLIDFHRTCFYTEEECNEWIKQHKEEEGYEAIPVESTLEYKLGFKAGKESEKQKEQKPDWSEEDKEALDMCLDAIPKAWKTKSGILLTKWLKDNIHLQPKQEWSEEDETRLTNILIMLKEYVIHHYSKDDVDKSVDWLENRLKSLRPQYHGDVTMTEAYKMGFEAGKASSWKPSEEQTNNVIVELTQVELGDIINGLYYLKEKYYEDCKEHNGTATIGLSDEFKFYFKRFNEVLDLYTRLHELEKEKYGTTTDGYYYE